jgi:hypothetical protein
MPYAILGEGHTTPERMEAHACFGESMLIVCGLALRKKIAILRTGLR